VCRSRQSQDILRTPSTRRTRRSIRSGYAFAHQEGFGRLITSGKIMRKLPKPNGSDFSFPLSFTSALQSATSPRKSTAAAAAAAAAATMTASTTPAAAQCSNSLTPPEDPDVSSEHL
jgi:hypothetical protein